ncbi:MAG: PDDEXK nuclease domain-containing protein [Deltaproteobacteria bacterium]|nr:PDDEXK nuclease domain-containing protein [Deltaproteobacteria bacterium]
MAKQENLGWGKAIVETLAKDLQKEFPGIQGFSVQNLWNMRQFYSPYKDDSKLQPLVGEISWTKNVIIMQRCKDDIQREFYIKITKKFGWTKDVLINQLEAGTFERYMANQTSFDKTVPEKYRHQAKLAIKDEYSFDFLEIGGIILCKDKNRTIVAYALKDTKKPIGVSTYKLTEKLPRELKKYLSSPAEMIERIKYLE